MTQYNISPKVAARYEQSISLIEKAFRDGAECADAVEILTEVCEAGRKYGWKAEQRKFQKDKGARQGAGKAASAAETLGKYLGKYPEQTRFVYLRALQKSGFRMVDAAQLDAGTNPQSNHPAFRVDPIMLADLLEAFAGELAETGPDRQIGDPLYTERYGPLLYQQIIERRRLPQPETAHLLYMVFLLRKLDGGWRGWDLGEPMPKVGRPHYRIAAMLVNQTFGYKDTSENWIGDNSDGGIGNLVRVRLASNPELGFVGYD